ncbi:MAG: tRNA guanosine(34) transglycosylase Tgt [Patescibacteria group bacterium]
MFKILKQSTRSRARIGILKTPHGEIETPCLVPVATSAVVKTLTSEEAAAAKCQALIANTYHLHLQPGEQVIKRAGGLHQFMHWDRPLMTDSGGFQVFSLGFGKEFGINKMARADTRGTSRLVLSLTNAENKSDTLLRVPAGQQPKLLTITDDGVEFRSHRDGAKLFIGPKESMRIQAALDADIIFAFDECPPPHADKEYLEESLRRTHRWAQASLQYHSPRQALFGIVQGGRFQTLRRESARCIAALPFDGIGIGGEFGHQKTHMNKMLNTIIAEVSAQQPRHLLGVGHLEDIPLIIKAGIDTFDCTVPTHYARHGIAFTSHGRLDMAKSRWLRDNKPLDRKCACFVCCDYRRTYLCHLLRAKEITGLKLLTYHNLFFFNTFIEQIKIKIKTGTL